MVDKRKFLEPGPFFPLGELPVLTCSTKRKGYVSQGELGYRVESRQQSYTLGVSPQKSPGPQPCWYRGSLLSLTPALMMASDPALPACPQCQEPPFTVAFQVGMVQRKSTPFSVHLSPVTVPTCP